MAGKCKACHSELLSEIDDRLRRGDTCESIAVWCNANGLAVATPSINRHRDKHVAGIKTPDLKVKSETYNDMPPIVDIDSFLENLEKDYEGVDVRTTVGDERRTTQLLLERILQNQLIVVHELQIAYTKCKGSYPDSQIRGLKVIFDMVNSLPTYEDKKVLRQLHKDNLNYLKRCITYEVLDSTKDVIANNDVTLFNMPYEAIDEYLTAMYGEHTSEAKTDKEHSLNAEYEGYFYNALPENLQDKYVLQFNVRVIDDKT